MEVYIHRNAESQADCNLQDLEACEQKSTQTISDAVCIMVTSSETRLEECDMNKNTGAPILLDGACIGSTQHGF